METQKGLLSSGLKKSSYRTYEEWKPFTTATSEIASTTRSYRTYEEWKQASNNRGFIRISGSYRTYEEWKPRNALINAVFVISCSYRTYEEWKLN